MEMRVSTPSNDVSLPQQINKSTEKPPVASEEVSTPPSLRKEAKSLPLIVELTESKPYYDKFNVKFLSENIDDLINMEIANRGLADNEDSYKSIVKNIVKKLGLENADIFSKLEKINDYLMINKKMMDAIKAKERLLMADPITLSSEQLKKRWELNAGF